MTENIPSVNPASSDEHREESGRTNSGRFLAINHLHYHANDLSELRKLAEVDPALADKVVEQRDRESARVTASYNFGLICSIILLSSLLIAFTCMVIFAGAAATIITVGAILATALLVRVILTGEWSETTWFGKIISAIVRALGGSAE